MKIENPQKFLEQHFPTFFCALSFSEILFLFEVNESSCGGDDVSDVPCGFIIRNAGEPSSVLFLRDFDYVVFHGIHPDLFTAYDYACERTLMELFQSDFSDLTDYIQPLDLSTESVDN